jgi:hypothetical protein
MGLEGLHWSEIWSDIRRTACEFVGAIIWLSVIWEKIRCCMKFVVYPITKIICDSSSSLIFFTLYCPDKWLVRLLQD